MKDRIVQIIIDTPFGKDRLGVPYKGDIYGLGNSGSLYILLEGKDPKWSLYVKSPDLKI